MVYFDSSPSFDKSTGSGDNTLKLNLDDLLDASTSTNILKVLGNSGDEVIATGFDDSTIDKTVNGITYAKFKYNIRQHTA
jgi:hypothetical protein